jgi:hypothetical protein
LVIFLAVPLMAMHILYSLIIIYMFGMLDHRLGLMLDQSSVHRVLKDHKVRRVHKELMVQQVHKVQLDRKVHKV